MKERRGLFAASRRAAGRAALYVAIFAAVFALYHLPVAAVLYPALLCLLLSGGFALGDHFRQKGRREALRTLEQCREWDDALLPQPESQWEQAYQGLLRQLHRENIALRERGKREREESEDYYIAWVHQIKTPIAAMKLTLQRQEGGESRQLSAQLRRIEQYVEMVLAYRRLGSESHDYVFRSHVLDELIRRTLRKLAPDFIDRHIALSYEGAEGELVTDEKWFSFLLEQILSNALKYTPEGGRISLSMTAPRRLTVQDTGIGIAPEDLPRIFEPGYTGHNGRRDKSASGLGLYLAARVGRELGIVLSAESQPGEGSRVHLTLPEEYTPGE